MDYSERCEAVRHCRWVDEVVPDAPWVIDAGFLEKYKIDYVAHDEEPYLSAGHEDVYEFVKSRGLPASPSLARVIRALTLIRQIHTHAADSGDFNEFAPRAHREELSKARL